MSQGAIPFAEPRSRNLQSSTISAKQHWTSTTACSKPKRGSRISTVQRGLRELDLKNELFSTTQDFPTEHRFAVAYFARRYPLPSRNSGRTFVVAVPTPPPVVRRSPTLLTLSSRNLKTSGGYE